MQLIKGGQRGFIRTNFNNGLHSTYWI